MNTKYEPLFEPFTFDSGVTIDNRLLLAPMTTNSSFENGMTTMDERIYYERRSGELGALITACAHVREDGKFAASPSISDDSRIDSLKKLATSIQKKGSKAILQIFHVGRMGSYRTLRGVQPISASAVAPIRDHADTPRALPEEEVSELVADFYEATRRAILAGFDGVELHGANTYLIQQFFSPHSNRRVDYWGGTLEKRMNFPIAVVEAAEKAIEKFAEEPFALGYRVSPEEVEEPGITIEDSISLLKRLKEHNLDYIHLSLGDIFSSSLREPENQTPIIHRIKEEIGEEIPLIGVGQVNTPEDAIDAMDEFNLPLIALGRSMIIDPDWITKVKHGEIGSIRHEIELNDREDLMIPDAMWEYINSRPDWLPIVDYAD